MCQEYKCTTDYSIKIQDAVEVDAVNPACWTRDWRHETKQVSQANKEAWLSLHKMPTCGVNRLN